MAGNWLLLGAVAGVGTYLVYGYWHGGVRWPRRSADEMDTASADTGGRIHGGAAGFALLAGVLASLAGRSFVVALVPGSLPYRASAAAVGVAAAVAVAGYAVLSRVLPRFRPR